MRQRRTWQANLVFDPAIRARARFRITNPGDASPIPPRTLRSDPC